MLKVWGRANSVNVQKVLWTCEELALPYKRIEAGMEYGVVSTPEYKKLNPNAMVPTIDDDGFVLWESNAIVRYLAAKYGAGSLCPADLQIRASADRWMDWQQTTLWTRGLRDVFWTMVRTKAEDRDKVALEVARAKTAEHLKIVEDALTGNHYVCGSTLSTADIALGAAIHRWFGVNIERPASPNLEAYYQRLTQRPAYAKTVHQPLT
jgi:glutathione S-transferase